MISVCVMNKPRLSLSKSDFFSAMADYGAHHLLIDRQSLLRTVGLELQAADDAAEGLAERTGAEAFLARGFPRDRNEGAARDLEVDAETREVVARRPEDRALRLDEDPREIALGEVIQHDDRLEPRDELRRHPVAKEVVVLQVLAQMERQLLAHLARRRDDDHRLHRLRVLADRGGA